MRRLQGYAADALLECCAQAATAGGAGSLEERRGLLSAATESLQELLAVDCPTPLAPECMLIQRARRVLSLRSRHRARDMTMTPAL